MNPLGVVDLVVFGFLSLALFGLMPLSKDPNKNREWLQKVGPLRYLSLLGVAYALYETFKGP